MNNSYHSHPFWGNRSPLSSLAGLALILISSSRLAYTLTVSVGLLWIYLLTGISLWFARSILPERGRSLVILAISCFIGALYLWVHLLINPFLGMECFFPILLGPLVYTGSGTAERIQTMDLSEGLAASFFDVLVYCGLSIALSLIREPLGFLSLSFPGGSRGMIFFFAGKTSLLYPVSLSSGAFLLLGYGIVIYNFLRGRNNSGEEDQ